MVAPQPTSPDAASAPVSPRRVSYQQSLKALCRPDIVQPAPVAQPAPSPRRDGFLPLCAPLCAVSMLALVSGVCLAIGVGQLVDTIVISSQESILAPHSRR